MFLLLLGEGKDEVKCGTSVRGYGKNLYFLKPNLLTASQKVITPLANHCIGQIYCSDSKITKNGERLFDAILKACDVEISDLLYYDIHKFEPSGASVVVIHPDFYFTTHPWHQLTQNIAPADIYVRSGSSIDPVNVMKKFAKELNSESSIFYSFARGSYNSAGELLKISLEYATPGINSHGPKFK